MAGWFTRMFGEAFPANPPIANRSRPMSMRRSFEAGATDRLTSSWTTTETTTNQDLFRGLRTMRARSKEFCRNTELGQHYLNVVKGQVVGATGFALSVKAMNPDGSLDAADSTALEKAFARWSKRGVCDVTGKLSFTEVQHLLVEMIARDGEVLVRKVMGKGAFGFQLQILSAHLLDENHNVELTGGNVVRMGVEFDHWGKPLAYHLRERLNDDLTNGLSSGRYIRVPAEEMFHLFVSRDASQWRGIPWAHSALRKAHQLDRFEEAALIAADVGASKMGFYTSATGDAAQLADEDDGHEFMGKVTPGMIEVLPEGTTFESFDPSYPNEIFEKFVKVVTRSIAIGLNVSYSTLSGDLSEGNYGSIRQGMLSEQDAFRTIQGWFVEAFLAPLYTAWLTAALTSDKSLSALPFYKFDKFDAAHWQGRGFDWIDPANEMKANEVALRLGLTSRAELISKTGRDSVRVRADIEAEKDWPVPTAPSPAPTSDEAPADK